MLCPNCGNESSNNDISCKHCGYIFKSKDFSFGAASESSISEEIPSAEEKQTANIGSTLSEEVPFKPALSASIPENSTQKAENNIENLPDEGISESAISEEIPSIEAEETPNIGSSLSEEVPYESAIAADIPENPAQKAEIFTENLPEEGISESAIPEEIPSIEAEETPNIGSSLSEEVPYESAVVASLSNSNKESEQKAEPIKPIISEEISQDSAKNDKPVTLNQNTEPPKKKKGSIAFLIIALLLIAGVAAYFGITYLQTGNNIFSGSTAAPQTTATIKAADTSAYSANIVETVVNGKTYYSLIVNGKSGSTITVDNKSTYKLEGVSLSIPINVSDYLTNNQTEASVSIKVKIVGPDNQVVNIDVPSYTFKAQSTTSPTSTTSAK